MEPGCGEAALSQAGRDRGLGTTGFESLLKRVASRAGRQPSRYAEAFESASCCALAFTACMSSLPVPSDGRAST